MVDEHLYRNNVGIMVINKKGLVLACRRSNLYQLEELNVEVSWQMPQGGVNQGENIIDAGFRELEEETAIKRKDVEFIDFWDKYHFYNFDDVGRLFYPQYKGQKQKWLVVRYLKDDDDVFLDLAEHDEFNKAEWQKIGDLIDHVWEVKRPIYKSLAHYYQGILAK